MKVAEVRTCLMLTRFGFMSAAAQQPTQNWTFNTLSFPAAIDSFQVASANRWPGVPELGTAVKYVTQVDPTAELDVYVYLGSADRPGADSARALAEFAVAMTGIREYAENQRGAEITIDKEGPHDAVTVDGRSYAGQLATFTLRQGGQRFRSLLMVFVRDAHYVKLRVTYNPAMRVLLQPHLARFTARVLADVVVR